MNYFKNKKQIVLLTFSVMSSITHVKAGDMYFPIAQKFFLDTGNLSDWNDSSKYLYAYMFGSNENNAWAKLKKNDNQFEWTIPNQNGLYGLVFVLNKEERETFDSSIKVEQTGNIYYNTSRNRYTFTGIDNGTILGYWDSLNYPAGGQISLDASKLEWNEAYVHMWNNNGAQFTTPMNKNTHCYNYSFTIPEGSNYCRLIFANNSNFNNIGIGKQAVDILYDNHSNCYTLDEQDSSGKIIGHWRTI